MNSGVQPGLATSKWAFSRRLAASHLATAWIFVTLSRTGFQNVGSLLTVLSIAVLLYSAIPRRKALQASLQTNHLSSATTFNETLLTYAESSAELRRKIEDANGSVARGELAKAEAEFHELSVTIQKDHSALHPLYTEAIRARAQALFFLGQNWSARCLSQQACDLMTDVLPAKFPNRLQYLELMANCLESCFELEEASQRRLEILKLSEILSSEGAPFPIPVPQSQIALAGSYMKARRYSDCMEMLSRIPRPQETFNELLCMILEAGAKAATGEKQVAAQLLARVENTMSKVTYNKRNAMYGTLQSSLLSLKVILGQYGPEDYDVEDLESLVREMLKDSLSVKPKRFQSYGNMVVVTAVQLAIFKAHRRHFKDSLNDLGQLIDLLSTAQQPLMWLCHAVKGAVLCWQLKYMEAEEHVSTAMMFQEIFFGNDSMEFHHTNCLLGYILLARGQLERAKVYLKKSYDYFASTSRSDIHQLLAAQQLAFCDLCTGEHHEAKERLEAVLQDPRSQIHRFASAKTLTSRCLGLLECMAENWDLAAVRFKAGIEHHDCVASSETSARKLPVGAIFGEWGLAWVCYEQGNRTEASKLIKAVHEHLQHKYGNDHDHKLTLSSRHDVIIIDGIQASLNRDLETLLTKSNQLLGETHQLTMKIRKSISLFCKHTQSSKAHVPWPLPERSYMVGADNNRKPQLAEVDILNWRWADDGHYLKVKRTTSSFMSSGESILAADLTQPKGNLPLDWWLTGEVQDSSIPKLIHRPRRTLQDTVMKATSDLYAQLLLDFRRDFSPAFIEHRYASSKDVPFQVCGQLGSGTSTRGDVEKVRDPVSDEVFARKSLIYTRSVDQNGLVRAEVNNMQKLAHQHIVKLCAGYIIPSEGIYALLMQPVADCNLEAYLQLCSNEHPPPEYFKNLFKWLPCLLHALDYMHSKKIRHKDIKPANILVKSDHIYFTDFGIARDWSTETASMTTGIPHAGTHMYWAPEVARWKPRGSLSDVFSLGCVFAEMITVAETQRTVKAFEGDRASNCREIEYHLCVTTNFEAFDEWFSGSETYVKLVRPMLHEDPTRRPPIAKLLEMLARGDLRQVGPLVCPHRPGQTDRA